MFNPVQGLNYWQNEKEDCYLTLHNGKYFLVGEWDNDTTWCEVSLADLKALGDSIQLLVD